MAFLPDQQDQTQQQNQQQGQVPTVPQIPTLQGTSGPTASGSQGTGVTNTASPGAAPSSPWQNITSYLSANAGQAGNVAGKIAQNLTDQYNQTSGDIGKANDTYQGKISAGAVPDNQALLSQLQASPSQFVADPNNVTQFQNQLNANYTGPQDFSHTPDFSNLQNEVLNAQTQAGLANQGNSGLMTLLGQAEQNPTQGVKALDALLMQENPANFQMIQGAAQPFGGLTDYLNTTQTNLDTAAQQAAANTATAKANAANALSTTEGNFQNAIANEMSGAGKQFAANQQAYQDYLNSMAGQRAIGAIESDMEQVVPQLNGMLPVFNDTQTGMPITPTLGTVATPDDFATAAALSQLAGNGYVSPLSGANSSLAGTWAPVSYTNAPLSTEASDVANVFLNGPGQQIEINNDQMNRLNQLFQQLQAYNGQVPNAVPINPQVGLGPTGGPPNLQPDTVNTQPGHVAF